MSGHDLIDAYLSELMDDPGKGDPAKRNTDKGSSQDPPPPAQPGGDTKHQAEAGAPTAGSPASAADPLAAFREGSATISDDEFEAMLDTLQGCGAEDQAVERASAGDPVGGNADPLAQFREGDEEIGDDEFEAMLDALEGRAPAAPTPPADTGDPLAAFREGAEEIGDDEFEALLDALEGRAPAAASSAATASAPAAEAGDPLAAFREGAEEIGDDEFEAMLDALQSSGSAPPSPDVGQPAAAVPEHKPAPTPSAAIQALLPPSEPSPAHGDPAPPPDQRRRAEDRITSWLRFNLARQCFAVEVLKVQEVLRVPHILPVRGTGEATLGVMNLRGQIVPVMDLAIRLGFSPTEPNEASRVIVLEENGETLGLLVASVADVLNLSDSRMERISGTPSLVAADVLRGISRRDGQIVIMLDASRLLT